MFKFFFKLSVIIILLNIHSIVCSEKVDSKITIWVKICSCSRDFEEFYWIMSCNDKLYDFRQKIALWKNISLYNQKIKHNNKVLMNKTYTANDTTSFLTLMSEGLLNLKNPLWICDTSKWESNK